MHLTTASQVIRFVGELEDTAAKFYEKLAEKYPEGKETFLSLVKENRKNKALVQRAYSEVVTDALETGVSFEELGADEYIFEAAVAEDASLSDVLQRALEIEEKIQKFYLNAAKMSKSLSADVPRAFERIAKKRRTQGKTKITFLKGMTMTNLAYHLKFYLGNKDSVQSIFPMHFLDNYAIIHQLQTGQEL